MMPNTLSLARRTATFGALSLAAIVVAAPSPYLPDGSTVLLYHLDDTAGSVSAANAVAGALPAIGNVGGVAGSVLDGTAGYAGFGRAARLAAGSALGVDVNGDGAWQTDGTTVSPDRFALSQLLSSGGVGAFTLELLINVPSIVTGGTLHQHLWGGDGVAQRAFQFRINSAGVLTWDPVPGGTAVTFDLTTLTGPHAFVANQWFHVAVTYEKTATGTPTTKLYWTRLDSGVTEANLVKTDTSLVSDLSSLSAPLVLGNEGRNAPNEGVLGLVDEGRLSRVARTATQFLFTNTDSDADGLPDAWELAYFPDLSQGPADDPDGDGMPNLVEFNQGSNPAVVTDPGDLDGDGLADSWEVLHFGNTGAQGASGDPDGDTLTNLQEFLYGTNPTVYNDPGDTDLDGLPDAWELASFGSLAQSGGGDFDLDGFNNAVEYAAGSDPANILSVPGDSDADGLSDAWELENFGNLAATGAGDPDGDLASNSAEQAAGTDPNDPASYPGAPVDPTRPTGLMVDLLALPHLTTVPDTLPEYTWIFNPARNADTQQAYEILVASTHALAAAGTGDVWSSGKVLSSQSVDVQHGGAALARGATYHWRVRTWQTGASAPSAWSEMQRFTIEATTPVSTAHTIRNSSSNQWSGRYQPQFLSNVPPIAVVNKGGGNWFIDFGRAGFGYAKLRLNGSFAGQTLEARFGEKAVGTSVDTAPGGTIRYVSTAVALANGDVTYDLRKASTTTGISVAWSGGVTPFRYLELLNCPGTITAADVRQLVLHTPFDDAASAFSSSNATLDAVWDLCAYSIKATTFCGVYVDGDRERKPYEADAYINQLAHYGVDREFTLARYSYEYLLDNPTWPTEWRLHFPLMAWADYLATGNREALAANYDAVVAQVTQFAGSLRSDGLMDYTSSNNIVDWPSGERDGFVFTGTNAVVNAFMGAGYRLLARMAEALGKTADVSAFTAKADALQTAFNTSLWNGTTYKDGETTAHVSAHANFFPMALGLVPADRVSSVMTFLKTKRMAPSVYGAQYLLEALFLGGEEDYAIGLMADDSTSYKRHWYNMIREGSTVTLEAWDNDFKSNLDWNHAWGAAPANILPRFVLGVQPLTPGYGRTEIRPRLGTGSTGAGLTHAEGKVPTVRGPVLVSAENGPTSFRLVLTIPGNMDARVLVPKKGLASAVLVVNDRIVAAPTEGDRLVLESLPAGTYTITLAADAAAAESVRRASWFAAKFGIDAANPAIAGESVDADGDGFSNLEEFAAGTDPRDAADRLAPPGVGRNGGVQRLSFPVRQDRTYTVERCVDLASGLWTSIAAVPPQAADGTYTLDDSITPAPVALYRLRAVAGVQ